MPKTYRISKLGAKVLSKVRHRKGHGVHSPFAFALITKVVEERCKYYAYEDIALYLQQFPALKPKISKADKLIFRLVNHFEAQKILEIGSGEGITTLFASSPKSNSECVCVELSPRQIKQAVQTYSGWNRDIVLHTKSFPQTSEKQDCIIIDLKNWQNADYNFFVTQIFPLCSHNTFIVIKHIRQNRNQLKLWRQLRNRCEITVSCDLYSLGILFFNPKLHKKNYRISF